MSKGDEGRDWLLDAKRSLGALAVGGVAGVLTGNVVSGAAVGVIWWLAKPSRRVRRPNLASDPERSIAVASRQLRAELELVADRPLDRRDLETRYEVRWFQARTRHGAGHPESTLALAQYGTVLLRHDRELPGRFFPELCQGVQTAPPALRGPIYELLAVAPGAATWIETLSEALQQHPSEVGKLHLVLARRARHRREFETARAWVERAKARIGTRAEGPSSAYRRIELTPPSGEEALDAWIALHVELAEIHQASGNLEAAHDALATLPIEGLSDARRCEVTVWRANTAHDAGRTGEALELLQRDHPGPGWKVDLERARLLLDLGESRAARDAARRGRSGRGSGDFEAEDWALFAQVEIDGGDRERGLRDHERATRAARGRGRTLEDIAPELELGVALANDRPLEGLAVAQRAVASAQRRWGEEHVFVADALRLEARACRAIGDHRRAEKLVGRGLELVQRHLGPRHPARAKLLELASVVRGARGLAEEAALLRHEALERRGGAN